MTQIFEFAIIVIVISASGVMAPGPLFAANVSYGLREGTKSGIKMAVGHTIVEFPLVILLGIGVFSLEKNSKELINCYNFECFKDYLKQLKEANVYIHSEVESWNDYGDIPSKEARILLKIMKEEFS